MAAGPVLLRAVTKGAQEVVTQAGRVLDVPTLQGLLQGLPSWCGSHGGSRIGGGAWGAGGEGGTGGTGGHLCWVLNPQGDSSSEH